MAPSKQTNLLDAVMGGPTVQHALGKGRSAPIRHIVGMPESRPLDKKIREDLPEGGKLEKSVLNFLNGPEDSIERLAFERDPQRISEFAGIWRPKLQLIPDNLLKRMAIQDDLVAAVVGTRCNHVSQFGRKQQDRHSKGFKLEVDEGVEEKMKPEQKEELQKRLDRMEKLLLTCGHTKGYTTQNQCSFTEFLYMSTRNAIVLGRMATEVIYVPDVNDPANEEKRRFHSFRPTDAGTIYYAAPYTEANQAVRESALKLLEQIKHEKLDPEKFKNEKYAWVQVLDGRPVQAFGPQEMLVQNFYPVTDIELQGYPLTPLDTAINAVTTHINITNHNKLYFQYGRAARGMLVIKSQDVDVEVVNAVKQQFNASINTVSNAWRMPVFGIGPEDELTWQAIDQGQRDMEFQYLSDSNARTIMAAFQMSPEELPGYQHLSRGTNNQALSESSNEYKLTAARDVGIRPLIAIIEDFLNANILPLLDPELSKFVRVRLIGLDIDDAEKESIRLQQDMPIHMTYDEVLTTVEKKPLGAAKGGSFPLNPAIQTIIKQYMTFGQIQEQFFGVQGGSQKPEWQFYENEAWMQMHQEQLQIQMAQQQAQAQAAGGGQPPPGGDDGGGGGGRPPPQQGGGAPQGGGDMSAGIDQVMAALGKAEKDLPRTKQRIRAHQKAVNAAVMESFKDDVAKLVGEVAAIADQHKKRS